MPDVEPTAYLALEITKDNYEKIAGELEGFTAEDIENESAHFLNAGHRVFLIVVEVLNTTEFCAIITESYLDAIWEPVEPKSTEDYFEVKHK